MDSISKLLRATVAAGVAAWLVLAAAPAIAQGMYYKEITKDGRIYVFNVAANAERFEKTGEMGIGITKPGAGPNGETIVGDNERAIQLYFFKHGISEPVPGTDPAHPDGGLARRQDAHHDRRRLSGNVHPRAGAVHGRECRATTSRSPLRRWPAGIVDRSEFAASRRSSKAG